jgi:hypothetical protein
MPLYLIEKKITAYLTLNCDDPNEALSWEKRIVATLEDEDGYPISPDVIDDFVATSNPNEVQVRLLTEDSE